MGLSPTKPVVAINWSLSDKDQVYSDPCGIRNAVESAKTRDHIVRITTARSFNFNTSFAHLLFEG